MSLSKWVREVEQDLGLDPIPADELTDPAYLDWLEKELDYKYTAARVNAALLLPAED